MRSPRLPRRYRLGDALAARDREDRRAPPPARALHTFRGGGWKSRADEVRAAMRGAFTPDVTDAVVGMRIAVDGADRR